jgi:hypothetical protein
VRCRFRARTGLAPFARRVPPGLGRPADQKARQIMGLNMIPAQKWFPLLQIML